MKLFVILLWIFAALLASTKGQWRKQDACSTLCGDGGAKGGTPSGPTRGLRGRYPYPFSPPEGVTWPGWNKIYNKPANPTFTKFHGNGVIGTVHKELQMWKQKFNDNQDCSVRYGRNYCLPAPPGFADPNTGIPAGGPAPLLNQLLPPPPPPPRPRPPPSPPPRSPSFPNIAGPLSQTYGCHGILCIFG